MKKIKTQITNELINKYADLETVEFTEPIVGFDISTNVAMKLTKALKKNPRIIAEEIVEVLKKLKSVKDVEIAGPGFINIKLGDKILSEIISEINNEKIEYGKGSSNKKINVEYVSANPTGHLHIGHARNAVLGSTIVNALKYAGNQVDSEYYINDAGVQMSVLGISTLVRYRELLGDKEVEMPESSYKGPEIYDFANLAIKKYKEKYLKTDWDETVKIFSIEAGAYFLQEIKNDLASINVHIDKYFSEKSLYESGIIAKTIKNAPDTFEQDDATWLRTTKFGDDKDRVLIKSDGTYTYFAPDISYHKDKMDRGYDILIDVWGGDHIGYIARMKCALAILGFNTDNFHVPVIQMVRLLKNGKEFKMSKRAGTSFTLRELVSFTNPEAIRYNLISQSANTGVDFDIDVANSKDSSNQIFTIQYTHARINQLVMKSTSSKTNGEYEWTEKERILIEKLSNFPSTIQVIAEKLMPHLLSTYLYDLCKEYNSYYSNSRVIGDDNEGNKVQLSLAVKRVIFLSLKILGINAPLKM